MKTSFCCPYLQFNMQNVLSVKGLYDTGAEILCISQNMFFGSCCCTTNLRKQKGGPHQSSNPQAGSSYQCRVTMNSIFRLEQSFWSMTNVIPDLNDLRDWFYPKASTLVLYKKSIICVEGPTQLGHRQSKGFQWHYYFSTISRLLESIHSDRRQGTTWSRQTVHCQTCQESAPLYYRWALLRRTWQLRTSYRHSEKLFTKWPWGAMKQLHWQPQKCARLWNTRNQPGLPTSCSCQTLGTMPSS